MGMYMVVGIPLSKGEVPPNIEAAYKLVHKMEEEKIIKECRINKEKDTAYFKFNLNAINDWMTQYVSVYEKD